MANINVLNSKPIDLVSFMGLFREGEDLQKTFEPTNIAQHNASKLFLPCEEFNGLSQFESIGLQENRALAEVLKQFLKQE